MREYGILAEPIGFLAILNLHMELVYNSHGSLRVSGYISDEEEERNLELLSKPVWETIKEVGKDGEKRTIFCGIVTGFSLQTENDQKKLYLDLKTGSCLLDKKKRLFSYQDSTYTYRQLFLDKMKEYPESGIIFGEPPEGETGELILQYEETDWEFLIRMASRKGQFLTAEEEVSGVKIYYGLPAGETFPFPEEGIYTIGKDLEEYRKRKAEGMVGLSEQDSLQYVLTVREKHRIGSRTAIKGRDFYLYRLEGDYIQGEMLYRCHLCRRGWLMQGKQWNKKIRGCSLDAVVKEVYEDKVRVQIIADENKGQDINLWYPYATVYSTPDGTGWYCMPEPGDQVRLAVPEKWEGEAFVASSVHMETECKDRKNPEHKVIKSKYGKEVRFTPDSIVITNNQGTRVELVDGEGIHLVSSHSILLEAEEDLTVSSDTGSLTVAGTSSVRMTQQGTGILLEDGIFFTGGELRVQ